MSFDEGNRRQTRMPEGILLRQASVTDASIIARHRRSMFRDMGYQDETALDRMTERFLPWVESKLESQEYVGWLAVDADDVVAAGAGVWLMDWPAHMVGSSAWRGNILNVYTEPQFRR